MSESIAFTDVDVSADGVVRCAVTRETVDELEIRLPYSFTPEADLIAAAFATMCGTRFDHVKIDLPLGEQQAQLFQQRLGCDLQYRRGVDKRRRPGTGQALSFSGGFDSLAARELLPDAQLISLDFGGRFSREAEFFKHFSPLTFRTNLTQLGLNRNSWQFMGIGAILLRDELDLGQYAFGSILASSIERLNLGPIPPGALGIPVANYLGMELINPVAGITEVAAMSIVARRQPALLRRVLMSVALPREDKFQRKHQMLEAVTSELDLPISLPELPAGVNKLEWGSSFATDLSSLYLMKVLGVERVANTYSDSIPDFVANEISGIDMSFVKRFNPHAYENSNASLVSSWSRSLIHNGIMPYARRDWTEAERAIELLNRST